MESSDRISCSRIIVSRAAYVRSNGPAKGPFERTLLYGPSPSLRSRQLCLRPAGRARALVERLRSNDRHAAAIGPPLPRRAASRGRTLGGSWAGSCTTTASPFAGGPSGRRRPARRHVRSLQPLERSRAAARSHSRRWHPARAHVIAMVGNAENHAFRAADPHRARLPHPKDWPASATRGTKPAATPSRACGSPSLSPRGGTGRNRSTAFGHPARSARHDQNAIRIPTDIPGIEQSLIVRDHGKHYPDKYEIRIRQLELSHEA